MHAFARASVIIALALAAAGSVVFVTGRKVPKLTAPIKLAEAYALADGGSVHIVLKDREGHEFMLGARGSLGVPRSEFPVYVQRWYPWIPFPITLSPRGADERELLSALNGWVGIVEPASEALTLSYVQAILNERNARLPHPNR